MANEKNTEKMKALDAVLLQIEKQYGKGSIMRLGRRSGQNGNRSNSLRLLDVGFGFGDRRFSSWQNYRNLRS